MKEIILVKLGEIVLKGLNRKNFEDTLIRSLKRRLAKIGSFHVRAAQSTIYVEPVYDDADMDEAADCVAHIFGIAAFARACSAEKDLEQIKQAACEYLKETMEDAKTFKVESKRSDKKFPYKSPEISAEVGSCLLEAFPHLTVNVHEPDVVVTVEVRDFGAYIRAGLVRGAGGIPIGTGGKAAVLISGGIDSPVASYMMAKRGLELIAVHFASPPYTSVRAEEKVAELLHRVARYTGRIRMFTVPFTEIQEQIRENCHEEYFTIIMRRFMMQISERDISIEERELVTLLSSSNTAFGRMGKVAERIHGYVDQIAGLPDQAADAVALISDHEADRSRQVHLRHQDCHQQDS